MCYELDLISQFDSNGADYEQSRVLDPQKIKKWLHLVILLMGPLNGI